MGVPLPVGVLVGLEVGVALREEDCVLREVALGEAPRDRLALGGGEGLIEREEVGVGVLSPVPLRVPLGETVGVALAEREVEGVGVTVLLGVTLGVGAPLCVLVGLGEGLEVPLPVGEPVSEAVGVALALTLDVAVPVALLLGETVAVLEGLAPSVSEGLGVAE